MNNTFICPMGETPWDMGETPMGESHARRDSSRRHLSSLESSSSNDMAMTDMGEQNDSKCLILGVLVKIRNIKL